MTCGDTSAVTRLNITHLPSRHRLEVNTALPVSSVNYQFLVLTILLTSDHLFLNKHHKQLHNTCDHVHVEKKDSGCKNGAVSLINGKGGLGSSDFDQASPRTFSLSRLLTQGHGPDR